MHKPCLVFYFYTWVNYTHTIKEIWQIWSCWKALSSELGYLFSLHLTHNKTAKKKVLLLHVRPTGTGGFYHLICEIFLDLLSPGATYSEEYCLLSILKLILVNTLLGHAKNVLKYLKYSKVFLQYVQHLEFGKREGGWHTAKGPSQTKTRDTAITWSVS